MTNLAPPAQGVPTPNPDQMALVRSLTVERFGPSTSRSALSSDRVESAAAAAAVRHPTGRE